MVNYVLLVLLQFAFEVSLLSIFGKEEALYFEDLKRCYYTLEKGYNSMPINLPGTLFHKAMKARKELAHILTKILSTRREMKRDHNDLLGSFMGEKEGLTDEQIADNVIGLIFAARDTTASVLTWILKYLGENPSVLQAVTVRIISKLKPKPKFHFLFLELRNKLKWILLCSWVYRMNKKQSWRKNRVEMIISPGLTPKTCRSLQGWFKKL